VRDLAVAFAALHRPRSGVDADQANGALGYGSPISRRPWSRALEQRLHDAVLPTEIPGGRRDRMRP
jgi:hypothetical protein